MRVRKNLNVRKGGLNGLQPAHMVAVPVADYHVADRLVSNRADLRNYGFTHHRTPARIEDNNAPFGDNKNRIPFLRKLKRILPNAGPNARRQLLPTVLKRICNGINRPTINKGERDKNQTKRLLHCHPFPDCWAQSKSEFMRLN